LKTLISVVIPVFNQKEAYLRRCIDSVLLQEYSEMEIIVSDNHSSNACMSFLQEYNDPRLRLIKPPCHLPLVQHFAFAGFHANGELLSFLPSDDWLEPDWLHKMHSFINHYSEAAFAYCDAFKHDLSNNTKTLYRGNDFSTKYLKSEEAIKIFGKFIGKYTSAYMVGALIRREAYFKYGGLHDSGAIYSGDACMGLGLLKYGGVAYLSKPLVNYTVWTEKEGKVDDHRDTIACQDMAKVLSWATNDIKLIEIAKEGNFSFAKARARMSIFYLLVYVRANIENKDCDYNSFQEALYMISNGFLPKWITSIFKTKIVIWLLSIAKRFLGEKVKYLFLG
jgi:GT2 family glycosyltransferase